jgi:Domain of unknown function (DUF6532)
MVRSKHGEVAKFVQADDEDEDDEDDNDKEGASTDDENAVEVHGRGGAAVRHPRIPQQHCLTYYNGHTYDFLKEVRRRWMLFIITENAFPAGDLQTNAMQAAFNGAAHKLPKEFRGSTVQKFDKHIRRMLKNAANQTRGLAKTTAKSVVATSYSLLSTNKGGKLSGKAMISDLVDAYLTDYEWIKGDYYPVSCFSCLYCILLIIFDSLEATKSQICHLLTLSFKK